MILSSLSSWRLREPASEKGRSSGVRSAISRRTFTHSTLAATALAALPARAGWADASKPANVPAQLGAIGLTGKPVTVAAADIKELRAALRGPLLLAADDAMTARVVSGTPPSITTRRSSCVAPTRRTSCTP